MFSQEPYDPYSSDSFKTSRVLNLHWVMASPWPVPSLGECLVSSSLSFILRVMCIIMSREFRFEIFVVIRSLTPSWVFLYPLVCSYLWWNINEKSSILLFCTRHSSRCNQPYMLILWKVLVSRQVWLWNLCWILANTTLVLATTTRDLD